MPKLLTTALLVLGLAFSGTAWSHLDEDQPLQSYRQSWFALIGFTVNPLFSMLKGETPWDEKTLAASSGQLATLVNMEWRQGFAPGSEQGTTRAKPEIWENREDFKAKMEDLRKAANELDEVVAGGEREAIAGSIGALGQACKACHDEYKSKDYLY
ncbi:MAG: cytochrome c [Halioglobus sp.]|nr:cytochrome c [Halioglobus sp.]